jgi:hypothetical protein
MAGKPVGLVDAAGCRMQKSVKRGKKSGQGIDKFYSQGENRVERNESALAGEML